MTEHEPQQHCLVGDHPTPVGPVPVISTKLEAADLLGAVKARFGVGRMRYQVAPGLYAVGEPGPDSDVLVSANYKLSFDALRKELGGRDLWIMVLDTKGINVWCAAGKGTFGTDEIVRRVEATRLGEVVESRRLIVPQLGAPGVAAHEVLKRCGFKVMYGPVRARDIPAFIEAGYKAIDEMRRVRFTLKDRVVLTPMEFVGGAPLLLMAAILLFLLSGLCRQGYSGQLLLQRGPRALLNLFVGYVSGTVIGPALLPWLPGRSFSVKGAVLGAVVGIVVAFAGLTSEGLETGGWIVLLVALVSFGTMNFTGASTYTSLSGVKKELRVAVPLQLFAAIVGLALVLVSQLT